MEKLAFLCLLTSASSLVTYTNGEGRASREDSCVDLGYEEHPTVIVSMDGFRADYMDKGITPNLQSVKDRGVSAPYMKPVYPSETFPNHYTIVTGLYPESHGIISNDFCDRTIGECFSVGSNASFNPDFWGGDPIWNTVTAQGKLSAALFWAGADVNINGQYPTYWQYYDGFIPYEDRIEKVLEWLSYPIDSRPIWISVYFDQPDKDMHQYGPDSFQVDDILVYMDGIVGSLIDGIDEMNLTDCVNLMIVSDHGLSGDGNDTFIRIDNYIPGLDEQTKFYQGAFSRIDIMDEFMYLKEEMMRNLSCQDPFMRQYDRTELPKRLHWVNNERIEDIVLDLDPPYSAQSFLNRSRLGDHGYDYYFREMEALFLAAGPEFKVGYVSEPFQNIELYNLMCELVDIVPSVNNGTEGSLYQLLVNPPQYPTMPTEDRPDVAEFPDETVLTERLNISECEGDLTEPEPWLYSLNFSASEQTALESYHLPWGLPYTGSLPADVLLLHHEDHVTGYSETLKMPLWTSFTLGSSWTGSPSSLWSSDVRLDATNTPTCTSYESLQSQNITQSPLFRPGFSVNSTMDRIPFLVSNAVPMSLDFEGRWSELQDELIPLWASSGTSDLNVITGPVFDSDGDSFVDNFTEFSSSPQPASDFFAVLTRCNTTVASLQDCLAEDLDTLGFIYHDGQIAPNCLSRDRYAQMFSCKIRDVEKATGLTLFTSLEYKDATRLAIRIHSDIWSTS